MGNSCSHAADAIAHVVTEDEIKKALQSIEDWHKAQAAAARNTASGKYHHGPLLERVGGIDVVKRVVELFYKKLYSDQRALIFLHDQDIMHLRAKQSAFVSWLFGPPNQPYTGRSVRIAHLRIIKQRGFSPEDFDMGMKYFEEAMRELGAPELIMGEVMRRMRPFKDAFFTPSAKDAEEEARWLLEEQRAKEEHDRLHREQEQQAQAQLQQQASLAGAAAALAGAAAAGSARLTPVSSAAPRGPQCPFTGGRLSRPSSRAGSEAAGAAAAVPVATAAGPTSASSRPASRADTRPPAVAEVAVAAASSSRPPSGGAAAPQAPPAAGTRVTGGPSGSLKRVASPKIILPEPESSPGAAGAGAGAAGAAGSSPRSTSAAVAAAAAAGSSGNGGGSSRPASQLSNKRPAGAGGSRPASATAAAAAASLPPPPPPPPPALSCVPDPLSEFEAAMEAIEKESAASGSAREPAAAAAAAAADGSMSSPRSPAALLGPSLESSASARKSTAVC